MRPAGQSSDLFFGDDFNYVLQRGPAYQQDPAYGVEIGANDNNGGDQQVWRFGTDGVLTLPDSSKIIANLAISPSTLFRTTNGFDIQTNGIGGPAWQFATNGDLTLPNDAKISSTTIGFNQIFLTNGAGGNSSDTNSLTVGIANPAWAAAITANPSNYYIRFGFDDYINQFPISGISGPAPGTNVYTLTGTWTTDGGAFPITISSNDYAPNVTTITSDNGTQIATAGGSWLFGLDGTLTLPQGGIITEGTIPGIGPIGNTIILTPSSGTSPTQQLLVYPTYGPDYNHLHLTSGNLANTELFLGNDDHYVKLVKTGEIEIRPNNGLTTYNSPSATWIFGTDANLSIPSSANGNGSLISSQTAINVSSGPYYLVDIEPFGAGGGMATLSFHQDTYPGILNVAVGDTIHNIIGDYLVSTVDSVSQTNITTITTTYNSGPQVTVNLFSFAKATATGGTWQFGTDGSLTFPDQPTNQRTGNAEALVFKKSNSQKAISTAGGTVTDPTVERLVIAGGDSYRDPTTGVYAPGSEGGDIYLWAGRGADGGDIKVDAGTALGVSGGQGGTVKIRGGYSQSGSGGFVEITGGNGGTNGGDVSIRAGQGNTNNGLVTINTPNHQWEFDKDGKLTAPGDVVPDADNVHNLGSPTRQWHHLYVSTGSIYLGNIKLSNEGGNLAVYNVNNAGAQNETQTVIKVVNSSPIENFAQDGGTASAVYDNLISFIECGGSARRGVRETYDGGDSSTTSNTVIINGGGA
jgi:hypothetical protein